MRIVLFYIIIPVVLLLLVFYWWAQGGKLDSNQLHKEQLLDELPAQPEDTLSVMTYNIGYLSGMTNNLPVKPGSELFDSNLHQARQLINKWQPDIIGFQEIDLGSSRSYQRNQVDSLNQGYHQAIVSVNWDKNYVPFPYWPPSVHFGRLLSAQAVLSKFPVVSSQRLVLSEPASAPFYYRAFYLDRLLQVLQVSVNGQRLVVLNVHLEAFDQHTREVQANEVMKVVDQYVRDQPLILMGDFNARPPFATEKITDEHTISMFLEHPLLEAALDKPTYLAQESRHFTFDTSEPYEKLDYIFYTPQTIEPIEVITLKEAGEISDHFPVLMTFKLLNR